MDDLVARYLRKIGIKEEQLPRFDNFILKAIKMNKTTNVFKCTIILAKPIKYSDYILFFTALKEFENGGGFISDISFEYPKGFSKDMLAELLDDYANATNSYDLTDYKINDLNIVVSYTLEDEQETIEEVNKFNTFLKKIQCGYKAIAYQRVEEEEEEEDEETLEEEPLPESDNFDFSEIEKKYHDEANAKMKYDIEQRKKQEELARESRKFHRFYLKDFGAFSRGYIEGVVFFKDIETIKNKYVKLKLYVYDGTSSVEAFFFINKDKEPEKVDELDSLYSVGQKLKICGTKEEYNGHDSFRIHGIPKILESDPLPEDNEKEKRVELHLHTKFSEMDGVNSIQDYASLAKHMGHKALAITDHGCVQGFPEAQKAGSDNDIKILYGAELYCVEEHLTNIFNPSNIPLRQAKYVVFDLETTGLSARYDRIIEFGAVKVSHGVTEDEIDFFVNPDMPLSATITNLTGIDNSMVSGGKSIKDALKCIAEFFGDAIIVAHNATFDVGFINEALKNNGFEPLTNPVIDTLPLSRYLYPKQRRHTLGAVARTMDVEYDEDSAHRAIYDAQVLNDVYQGMLSMFTADNPNIRHCDLDNLQNEEVIFNAHPFHATVLVKNMEGLKDLYKLISESNINYLGSVPLVPRRVLEKYRKNLLVGSACFNGEVFEAALTRSKDVLLKMMEFYDYIEVQPPCCYTFLVNDGQVASMDNVKKTCKDIIYGAKEIGKTVVATGDVHYLREGQKEFRDVYIDTKGNKGVPHPLNPYRRAKMPPYENPDQMYLSTKEMKDQFSYLEDDELIEEIVVKNTNYIASLIGDVNPLKDKLYTPTIAHCAENLEKMVYDTAKEMYGDPIPQIILDRIEAELKGIRENNYYVIYYIASQLVTKTNEAGYIVGSRGSVGSSLIATMSKITEVNPLAPHYHCKKCKYLEWADPSIYRSGYDLPHKKCPNCGEELLRDGQNIPFATFLGFHAEKVPDIDLNFPKDFQSQAHEMTKELLGSGNVFKAGTIETVADKTAQTYAAGYFERRGKNVPFAEILRVANGCAKVKKTTGQHPGGIIVIPDGMSVYDFTPIQYPADSTDSNWMTTHFDFHAIHDNVLKLDMLGHVDPYALKMMLDMTGVDLHSIPFDDKRVLSLFTSNKELNIKVPLPANAKSLEISLGTLGIPEFGTDFARRLLSKTKPTTFADLLIISGLSHGTNVFEGNAEVLISSKTCTLEEVIGCRDDIMTMLHDKYGMDYSDTFQIMELVRKGKFNLPSSEEKRIKYEKLMREHNVPEYFIESCKKIKYLFPRAHATAYCMMGVRVGWFKVYYPLEYYATFLTLRCDQYDIDSMLSGINGIIKKMLELNSIKQSAKDKALYLTLQVNLEMERRGYKLEHISLSKSQATQYIVDKENKGIIPPFTLIPGLGAQVAQSIVDARNKRMFSSEEDLIDRTRLSEIKLSEIKTKYSKYVDFDDIPESDQMTLF